MLHLNFLIFSVVDSVWRGVFLLNSVVLKVDRKKTVLESDSFESPFCERSIRTLSSFREDELELMHKALMNKALEDIRFELNLAPRKIVNSNCFYHFVIRPSFDSSISRRNPSGDKMLR